MDTLGATPPAGQTLERTAQHRPSTDSQRYPLAGQNRRPLAGPARAVRQLADGVQPLSPLATPRRLGTGLASPPSGSRRARGTGLESALRRWHRHSGPPACGGGSKKGGPQALGRSQGGFSTKIHLRAERGGKPLVFTLTGGERHEQIALPTLLETGAVKRKGPGRPRLRPDRLAGDKGYSSRTVRRYLRRRGIGDVIAHRSSDPPNPFFDRIAYRERNQVERLINRFKQYRRVATRYEKLAVRYHAVLTIVAILMWL